MIKTSKVLLITLILCLFGAVAFGMEYNLEEEYGINIMLSDSKDNTSYDEAILVISRGLGRFPEGTIKEVTEYNLSRGIKTNVILSKTEKIGDIYSEYMLNDTSANIFINTMKSGLYFDSNAASEQVFIHEMSHYISDYLFEVYGYDEIKSEFEKINNGCKYGTWQNGYDKLFANKHSANSFEDEVSDLMWYSVAYPDKLRNINDGNYTLIHKKLEYLFFVIDQSFTSVKDGSLVGHESLPQKPAAWAMDTIKAMEEASLIPEEFKGIYNSNITKEDFYIIALNIIEKKLGEENFDKSFEIMNNEEFVSIDPIKGEIFVDNNADCEFLKSIAFNENQERLHEAYQMGLIDEGWMLNSNEYINRLEVAKLFYYIASELGEDITDYKILNYDDLENIKTEEKTFIYFSAGKNLLEGEGNSFKPNDYLTYQEAYQILMRLYSL